MTITGYPFEDYDGTDASFEALMDLSERTGLYPEFASPADKERLAGHGIYHDFYLDQLAMADAQADHTAACERTVAPGRCTGCEEDAGELIPWTPRERLCWRCTDLQLDLLALAMGELWADAKA